MVVKISSFGLVFIYGIMPRCHIHVCISMTKSLIWRCEKMIHAYVSIWRCLKSAHKGGNGNNFSQYTENI